MTGTTPRPILNLPTAIAVATDAHAGQTDKGGDPYILHPLRVMLAVAPEHRVAAVLHDAIEDTPLTMVDLVTHGLTLDDAAALEALTRRDGENYMGEYIERVARGPMRARWVKLADLEDNLDLDHNRPHVLPDTLRLRYDAARDRIKAAIASGPGMGRNIDELG